LKQLEAREGYNKLETIKLKVENKKLEERCQVLGKEKEELSNQIRDIGKKILMISCSMYQDLYALNEQSRQTLDCSMNWFYILQQDISTDECVIEP
jgi:hypothetical protein